MPNSLSLQAFKTLGETYPKFFDWVSSHQEILAGWDPDRWKSPDWERRVTPQAIAHIFGRPMPEKYFRFLRAFCYAEKHKRLLGIECQGGMHIYPETVARLAEGEEVETITPFRYSSQPEEFYPFAIMGVDGVSYNFYFDGDEYVVVYFSPMDSEEVPFCYPDMESFLIDRILGSLALLEPDEFYKKTLESYGIEAEFPEATCLDCAVFMTAFRLQITTTDQERFQNECRDRVKSGVQAGKLPLLRQWL